MIIILNFSSSDGEEGKKGAKDGDENKSDNIDEQKELQMKAKEYLKQNNESGLSSIFSCYYVIVNC